MLSRAAKSVTYIGTIMLIVGLSFILMFSITLISIKGYPDSGIKFAKDYANWMVNQSGKSLETLMAIGIVVFVIVLIVIIVLIINYLFVNSKTALFQKWSYFINLIIGVVVFITTLSLLIFINGDGSAVDVIKTIYLIIFMTTGLSGFTLAIGSVVGLFTKATYIVEINHKSKKEQIKKQKIKDKKSKEIQAEVFKLEKQKNILDHKLEEQKIREQLKLEEQKQKEQSILEKNNLKQENQIEKETERNLANIQKEQIKKQKEIEKLKEKKDK